MLRNHYCGLISADNIDQEIILAGWVHKRRDLGGLIFFDLRDVDGLAQIVVEPDSKCFTDAINLKHEYVVQVHGIVRLRPNPNLEMPTGRVEVVANKVVVLNTANQTPIMVDDESVSEMNRLSNRVIDLRGQKMQHNLKLRANVTHYMREILHEKNFIDIETPYLTLSTPGGARDFLVPSRMHKGKCYALPQSPQIFKQLLMVAGFDRYYQIVRCFRDEELRADRQPEFTQIDIETSFMSEIQIREIAEHSLVHVFKMVMGIDLGEFPIMTYADAMYYYGSDKPDLRIDLKFVDLTVEMKDCGFKVFNQVSSLQNGRVVALKLPNTVTLSRKEIDDYTKFIAIYGAKGLAYIKINDVTQLNETGLQSPIVKFLNEQELSTIINKTNATNGETILFIADKGKIVNDAMGALRIKIANDKNLVNDIWAPLWVVDFPMFEYDEVTNTYAPAHHAFTAPKDEHVNMLTTNPAECLAKAYDMVLNGWEIAGGSVRIHNADVQSKVFSAMNLSKEEAYAKFGYLLDNLQFGAPPHGGIAFGLDRLVTLMCMADSIRDVIAFPKTTTGQCLLTNAPGYVSDTQLKELGIKLDNAQ